VLPTAVKFLRNPDCFVSVLSRVPPDIRHDLIHQRHDYTAVTDTGIALVMILPTFITAG
jgi:hypothetical protein|tara:strand:- start:738 stop:914 length:177 start_codon:yes stop_codon:yes gene_type:complete